MQTTRILHDGQVKLPEYIRNMHKWEDGQELMIINSSEGVLLTSTSLFEPTTLDDVAGCLRYTGQMKTLEDMEKAVAEGVVSTYYDRG